MESTENPISNIRSTLRSVRISETYNIEPRVQELFRCSIWMSKNNAIDSIAIPKGPAKHSADIQLKLL